MKRITQDYLDGLLLHDERQGLFKHDRESFTNPELFELEMKYLFEGNWIFLAHESQIAEINDYFTTFIGRQPIVITRNKAGELNAILNTCSHKGTTLCRYKKGNKSTFTCPFHGWTFNNSGKLLKVKDPREAGYPEQFNCDGSHDLKKVARFESYKGFLFGSLNPDVMSLEDYLGETKIILDQIVDQADNGIEVYNGSSSYTFNGNWKLQMENGADGYHVSSVHWNYVATMSRRDYEKEATKMVDANCWSKSIAGNYGYENGHVLLWTQKLNPEASANYEMKDHYAKKYGEVKADFMMNYTRNLGLYPNLFLMDQMSTQIRVVRPISVDLTEITVYCYGHKGESPKIRETRIRQYEDFFNVTGMGTPDDLEEFRSCNIGYRAIELRHNDMCRGATHWVKGPDEYAKRMGMNPILSGIKSEDEGLFVIQHGYWQKKMKEALEKEESNEILNEYTA